MAWQMGRIMLKFRPIAPKPAAMAPSSAPAMAVQSAHKVFDGESKEKRVSSPSSSSSGMTSLESSPPPPPPATLPLQVAAPAASPHAAAEQAVLAPRFMEAIHLK
uniref:Uncharacterized protein n=1 Tax=Leersia perrieri TaxID=77586 RepID=A0A0D9XY50_9ORYZ